MVATLATPAGAHEFIAMLEANLRARHGRRAAQVTDHLRGVYMRHLQRHHNTHMAATEPLRHLRTQHLNMHDRCDCTEEE